MWGLYFHLARIESVLEDMWQNERINKQTKTRVSGENTEKSEIRAGIHDPDYRRGELRQKLLSLHVGESIIRYMREVKGIHRSGHRTIGNWGFAHKRQKQSNQELRSTTSS